MVSVSRMMPVPSARSEPIPYHSLMTLVMKYRFGNMYRLLFTLCYLIGIVIEVLRRVLASSDDSSWWWCLLPLRASWLLLGLLPVVIMRKADLHIRELPYLSLAAEICDRIFSTTFVVTFAAYMLSASMFFGYYTKAMSTENSAFTTRATPLTQPMLNENALYLMVFPIALSLTQSVLHIAKDIDKLIVQPVTEEPARPMERLKHQMTDIVKNAGTLSAGFSLVVYPIMFYPSFRTKIWNITMSLSGYWYGLNKAQTPEVYPGLRFSLVMDTFIASAILLLLWNLVNTTFSIYMSLGPLRKGEGISESSPDRNGTLVSGLRDSKHVYPQSVAFQELLYVALFSPQGRVQMFEDLSRDQSMWVEVYAECKKQIVAVTEAANSSIGKVKSKPKPNPFDYKGKQQADLVSTARPEAPQIVIRRDNIFKNPKPDFPKVVQVFQDKEATTSNQFSESVSELFKTFTELLGGYQTQMIQLLRLPIGAPFRQTIQRRCKRIVPEPLLTCNAIMALSFLVFHSIDEDRYGSVQRTIPEILDTLCQSMVALDELLRKPPVSWTDVKFNPDDIDEEMSDIVFIRSSAQTAFSRIVFRFEQWIEGMDLTPLVQREIRKLYS
ncbi:nucleoporin protein Ndc1-Nup [Yarrowia lipolytica]|nr:nucleoporin protein Ndc1-Nup [Yarrowia lipolytica]RDW42584.1 nucleoporin protein Ndc1-Nup [Yarrowia lipolytica]RDW47282.1 nucleoporin protein Ndc1-Nup [Yarrowia lipolytica]RDW53451.1 nucleoporin protein Ndc1-Nup [Yarrowia lipolytica]